MCEENEMSKEEMLSEMLERQWDHDLDEDSPYEDILEEYQTMIEEYESAEEEMYPNGRDYDSEDFDD